MRKGYHSVSSRSTGSARMLSSPRRSTLRERECDACTGALQGSAENHLLLRYIKWHLHRTSKGQIAHQGTSATQCTFLNTTRLCSGGTLTSKCAYSQRRHGQPFGPLGAPDGVGFECAYFFMFASSFAGSVGTTDRDHTCPCGCGFEQPIIAPLF